MANHYCPCSWPMTLSDVKFSQHHIAHQLTLSFSTKELIPSSLIQLFSYTQRLPHGTLFLPHLSFGHDKWVEYSFFHPPYHDSTTVNQYWQSSRLLVVFIQHQLLRMVYGVEFNPTNLQLCYLRSRYPITNYFITFSIKYTKQQITSEITVVGVM